MKMNTATAVHTCDTLLDHICREDESYSEAQNRERLAIKYLLQYLERNGESKWIRFVKGRGIFGRSVLTRIRSSARQVRREKLTKETALVFTAIKRPTNNSWYYGFMRESIDVVPDIPLWPILSPDLDGDVTSHIVSFLDDKSLGEAARVSKAFYSSLVPRQRRVTLNGCQSLADVAIWNFTGMESFSGRVNSHLVEQRFLLFLSNEYPRLQHVDLYGCENLLTPAIVNFVQLMGARLKTFTVKFLVRARFGLYDVEKLARLLATHSSSLESLSLTLNREWLQYFDFSHFDGNSSLRQLSLTMDGGAALPKYLPSLESLKLEFIDEDPMQYWRQLNECRYPNLSHLDITVTNYAYPTLSWRIEGLLSALRSQLRNLKSFTIRRVQRQSPLDELDDRRSTPFPEAFTQELDRIRLDPIQEKEGVNQLLAFAKKRKIDCVVHEQLVDTF